MNFVWDTNSIIYLLKEQYPNSVQEILLLNLEKNLPIFSFISEIELRCYSKNTIDDIQTINKLLSSSVIINISNPIKEITINLRKEFSIKLPDAIIAATAIQLDFTLLTRNVKDFKAVKSLRIVDPWDLK